MIYLFEYNDYREYLADYYRDKKERKRYVTYRSMGKQLNVDPSYLIKLFKLEAHLKPVTLPAIVSLCELNEKESQFLEALFFFSKAKNEKDIAHHYEQMQMIRGVDALTLSTGQYEFYNKWYYSALWALLHIDGIGAQKKFGQLLTPKISEKEAKEALALLLKIGLIEKNDSGEYTPNNQHLKAGSVRKSPVKTYHGQMIDLGKESLHTMEASARTVLGMSLAVDEQCFEDINEILESTVKKIRARVDEVTTPDRVLQTNIQLFPIANTGGT